MTSFGQRMFGAAKLDANVYEEVEHDSAATGQAAGVVVLSSVAAGIGSIGYMDATTAIVVGTIIALVGWLIWAGLTLLIGTKLLPAEETEADMGQMLRTLGFATAPGVLRVLGFVPGIGGLIVLAGNIWMLVAMVVAVRQALDYSSTGRAVGVCLIGWVVLIALQLVVVAIVGPPASPNG